MEIIHSSIAFIRYFSVISPFTHADHFQSTGTVDVYFSPDGGTTNAIISVLNNAKSEILVQAYSFTSAPIAKAIIDARKRGIRIEVVLEKSQKTENIHQQISWHMQIFPFSSTRNTRSPITRS